MMIKRRVAAVVAATIATLGLGVSIPSLASAHTNSVVAVCTPDGAKVVVDLSNYNTTPGDGHANSVAITIDGAVVVDNADFGGSFQYSKTGLDNTADHTYKVKVRAWDDPEGSHGWSFNQSGTIKACAEPVVKVTPVAPKITQPVCTGPGQSSEGSFTVPGNGNGLKYTSEGNVVTVHVAGDQTNTVLADNLPDGWVRVSDKVAKYTVVYQDAGDCKDIVKPVAPKVDQPYCTGLSTTPVPGVITLPENADGIKYTLDGNTVYAHIAVVQQGGIKFAADLPTGWVRDSDVKAHYDVEFVVTHCKIHVAPVNPTFTPSVCTGPGTSSQPEIIVPTTEGVTYTLKTGHTGQPLLVATTNKGYVFSSVPEGWRLIGKHLAVLAYTVPAPADGCTVEASPVKPVVHQQSCTDGKFDGPSTIGIDDTVGVSYLLDGKSVEPGTVQVKDGEHTVEAIAQDGYVFKDNAVTKWTTTIVSAVCALTPVLTPHDNTTHLAFTGLMLPLGVQLAIAMAILGLGVLLLVGVSRTGNRGAHRSTLPLV